MTPPSRPRATPPVATATATALLLIGAIASAVADPTPRARTESDLPSELRNFDPAAFARLTQDQRFDFIIKALWWRDQQLQNFAYEVTHHIDQYPVRLGEPFDPRYVIKRQDDAPRGVKRKGAQYLFYGEESGRAFRARLGRLRLPLPLHRHPNEPPHRHAARRGVLPRRQSRRPRHPPRRVDEGAGTGVRREAMSAATSPSPLYSGERAGVKGKCQPTQRAKIPAVAPDTPGQAQRRPGCGCLPASSTECARLFGGRGGRGSCQAAVTTAAYAPPR